MAQLDTLWCKSHAAPDAPALDVAELARADPGAIGRRLEVTPHPAARWAWFDAQPVFSIWSRNRVRTGEADTAAPVEWAGRVGEGALLTRPADTVRGTPFRKLAAPSSTPVRPGCRWPRRPNRR